MTTLDPVALSGPEPREAPAAQVTADPSKMDELLARVSASGGATNLSVEQRRFWVLDVLGGGACNHVHAAASVNGPLDLEALSTRLRKSLRGLESANFKIVDLGGIPLRARQAMSLEIAYEDLGDLPAGEAEARLSALVAEETSRTFDLSNGALLRATLTRLASDRHVLLLMAHRIAFDRHSLELLLRRASGEDTGAAGDLGQHLQQERAWLNAPDYERAMDTWSARVAASAPLDLPVDHPRPRRRDHCGVTAERVLPASLIDQLRARGLETRAGVLAVFEIMMSRFTEQHDFAIGLPEVRLAPDDTRIGPYGETHVLQAKLGPRATLRSLVAAIADHDAAVRSRRPPPAAALIDRLVSERDLSRTPLFELTFEAHPARCWRAGDGAEWRTEACRAGFCVVDLALHLILGDDDATLQLCGNAQLFTRESVERMLGSILAILEQGARSPDLRIAEFDLFGARHSAERSLAYGPAVDAPAACLHQLFEAQCDAAGPRTALVLPEGDLSYFELNARANRLAHHLIALGIGPEDKVALCLERSLACYVALLAVHKAGAAYVPLDPAAPVRRLADLIADCNASILLTHARLADRFAQLSIRVQAADDPSLVEGLPTANPESPVRSENLAYIIYTSGSTGRPNGVEVTHAAAVNNLRWRQAQWPLTPADRLLSNFAFTFDPSVWGMLWPLTAGATGVVLPEGQHNDAQSIVSLLSKHEVTVYGAVPALLDVICDEPGISGCRALRLLPTGGEVLTGKLREKIRQQLPGAKLINLYGPTEATIDATFCDTDQSAGDVVPIGAPLPNVRAYVLDDQLRPVPLGVAGELYVGGANLARGYARRAALTADRFCPDPFSTRPGDRMYRTGDRVRMPADGQLLFLGRKDQQVKIRGYRVELGEVDACCLAQPEVREAATLVLDDARGRRLVVWVSGDLEAPALRARLAERLPPYMLPADIQLLPELPRTQTGKIDRQALSRMVVSAPQTDEEARRPLTPTEAEVARSFAAILDLGTVDPDQTFFDLGGNSLLLTRLASRLSQAHAIDLPVHLIFDDPTVAGVSRVIDLFHRAGAQEVAAAWTPERLQAEGEIPDDIAPIGPLPPEAFSPRQILVTGATGFVGAYLIERLLTTSPATVWCLVRAPDETAALGRLRETMAKYGIWDEAFADRVRCVTGDITKPRFGLSDTSYDLLALQIDAIFHAGAFVNFLYPYSALRPANVLSVIEALRLACTGRQKLLHFPSTVDVLLTAHVERPFLETDEALGKTPEPDGYRCSKWVAEKVVAAARARGVPICVYRLGLVVGHTTSGATQTNGYIAVGLKGFIDLGILPEDNRLLDLIPVDYAASAMVHLSRRPDSLGKVFHLWNRAPPPTETVYDWVRSFGYDLPTLPAARARGHILAVSSENPLYPLVPLVARERPDRDAVSAFAPDLVRRIRHEDECANTLAGLKGSGIECPVVTEALTHSCLTYLVSVGYIPAPPAAAA